MDARPIDADNHYYEPLDAFTRHLDKAYRHRGVRPVQDGKRTQLLIGGRVNRFVPNPTFDPIIVPGCLDPLFRGQIPEGVDPRSLFQVEPLRPEYQDRDQRLKVMDDQGLAAALLFPTLGCGVEEALRDDIPATMASLSAFNRWLEEDWGFDHEGRIIAAPMLSLADPEAAVTEVDSLLERGARVVHVRPAPVPGPAGTSRSLGNKVYDPVWARLAEASVPVAFHLGDSGYQRRFGPAWGGRAEFDCLVNGSTPRWQDVGCSTGRSTRPGRLRTASSWWCRPTRRSRTSPPSTWWWWAGPPARPRCGRAWPRCPTTPPWCSCTTPPARSPRTRCSGR